MLLCTLFSLALLSQQRAPQPQPIEASPTERKLIEDKVGEIERVVGELRKARIEERVIADIAVYAKAGRWLLEFPGFYEPRDISNALAVLDQGLQRANQMEGGFSPWVSAKGRKIHGYVSRLDGSVQPYGIRIPDSYDGSKPVRLYVWLHGRNNRLTEASFIHGFATPPAPTSTAWSADVGQIQLDCYGRGNNANHWAGEVDVYEAIADLQARYKIDPKRIILRGFSLGGAAAWHIALQNPSQWAAAEIGAGTWPRRYLMADAFPPHQAPLLRIWENITDQWALNAFNVPIVAHDGDNDTGTPSIPPPPPGTKHRGQLESSIRVREQLAREGYPSEGDTYEMVAKGTPSIFLISKNTGHATSPEVRKKVDGFLKAWGDKGLQSPDHVRFVTFTTRYNRAHWVSVEAMGKHYERAEVDAVRSAAGSRFTIKTQNVTRLALSEMSAAKSIEIDGQKVKVKGGFGVTLDKASGRWKTATAKWPGLHKTHALQGPIDDAFLDPFLIVKPTGKPWNAAAHEQAMRILARFDRLYARNYRSHPRVKDDRDVTAADFANYNVVLFGDPGSNAWIEKVMGKLPLTWSQTEIRMGGESYAAGDHLPALVYPSPFSATRYVVLNSGLTIDEREYNGDYSLPRWGDFAILKVSRDVEFPDVARAGLFDEFWRIPR
ncbi:MAG: hypothetical protein JNK87_19975 [Bryobacterales bacterium]|nr:hypothetical protein [Bryobacterales bacterium]